MDGWMDGWLGGWVADLHWPVADPASVRAGQKDKAERRKDESQAPNREGIVGGAGGDEERGDHHYKRDDGEGRADEEEDATPTPDGARERAGETDYCGALWRP